MRLGEECGVFGGITVSGDIAPYIKRGLSILQHRGQENAGICCGDNELQILKGKGLVSEVLTDKEVRNIKGRAGIGHVRYSTQGDSDAVHAQPYRIKYLNECVAVAHNGNVQSAVRMRKDLENEGEVFLTNSDTEMILKKVVRELRTLPSQWKLQEVGQILKENFLDGAWSILFGFPGRVLAFRDPSGYRPLMFCEAEEGYFLASEDSAFNLLNVKKLIEIEPGEGIEITLKGYKIERFADKQPTQKCVFEHIYFARPDSNIFNRNVYSTRVELGYKCAVESPVDADVIVPVMDSGFAAAVGYSNASGIPLHMGLMRNRWIGRTFIQPGQQKRRNSVIEKLTPIKSVVNGKRLVLIDDSLVRGTTSREIVGMLKNAGAKEVHLRISSPMIVNVCHWGVDIPTKEELIANAFKNEQEICDYLGADSLAYLSFDGLQDIFEKTGWCYHCFERESKECCEKLIQKELVSLSGGKNA